MTVGSRLRSAVVPTPGGDDGGPPLSERGWRVTVLVLHVAFGLFLTLAVLDTLLSDVGSRAVLLSALGVLLVAYATLGAPAVSSRDQRRATAYLAVLVGVVGVLAWEFPELLFLMFLAFPQVWFLAESAVVGLCWTGALTIAATLGPLVHWSEGTEPMSGPGQTLVGAAFSVAMGLWVTRVLEQSRERALLIRELEATRAELAAAHREQGVAAERERWAREVHDTLAQGYTSIVVLAQTAAGQLPGDPGAAGERVALIEEVARENLAEARAMVAAFAPVALDSATLVEALARLAERFGRETGLATRLDTAALADDAGLTRAEEIVLLRGAQEALANVRRHAAASAVVLRVSRVGTGEAAQVSVHVEDDGVGFEPEAAAGVGLAGLRDRAEQVGGGVEVVSAPGAGTRVTVRVPAR
ncbi:MULTISPECIES: sensor histidine kinase [unclassified Modestobacter]|uniref:sensor histidine kinase n=1 Tax=unclassified Modestobacter TaxID=2643866 RepID=UPI0022AAB171|nr:MULTISPECIES: sensor histidine kinase [unclassified Modestobacter]MCZ2827161.1 sensor histidine kinase [Modestobacter sp. VKM Ac-2981]MCZ2854412.1 sensor histidine kinase [Modestobacter sp. VKM Ac-2982]